jgi:hypothetical protein
VQIYRIFYLLTGEFSRRHLTEYIEDQSILLNKVFYEEIHMPTSIEP